MSCGSPIPRGERIAKPAEWDSHLAGSAFWGSGHCSCGLDRSTRDLDRSDRQPECPGATRSPAPRQRSCSPAACSPSAANLRHHNSPQPRRRRSMRARRWRPRSPSSGPEPWPRAAPLATKPPQPSSTRSPAPSSPSVTTSTRVGRSRTTRAVTTRAGGGTTRARAPRSATTSMTRARPPRTTSPTSGPRRAIRPRGTTATISARGTSWRSTASPLPVPARPRSSGSGPISPPIRSTVPSLTGTTHGSAPAAPTAACRRRSRCGRRCTTPGRTSCSRGTSTTTSGSRRRRPAAPSTRPAEFVSSWSAPAAGRVPTRSAHRSPTARCASPA